MKSLLSTLLCASLMLFATSCGKSGGGSGSNSSQYFGNLSQTGLSTQNQQALNNLTKWYNGTAEGSKILGLVKKEVYEYSSTAAQSNCTEKKFLGIPYTYCTSSNNSTGGGTLISSATISLQGTINNQRINQKGNAELQAIFNNSIGQVVGASQSGSVYRLDYLTADQKIISLTVDTSYHSALNPVKRVEQTQTEVKQRIVFATPTQIYN